MYSNSIFYYHIVFCDSFCKVKVWLLLFSIFIFVENGYETDFRHMMSYFWFVKMNYSSIHR